MYILDETSWKNTIFGILHIFYVFLVLILVFTLRKINNKLKEMNNLLVIFFGFFPQL